MTVSATTPAHRARVRRMPRVCWVMACGWALWCGAWIAEQALAGRLGDVTDAGLAAALLAAVLAYAIVSGVLSRRLAGMLAAIAAYLYVGLLMVAALRADDGAGLGVSAPVAVLGLLVAEHGLLAVCVLVRAGWLTRRPGRRELPLHGAQQLQALVVGATFLATYAGTG